MTSKNTKRALLMSCLSLLLCMSMLVGTTFAWFTDTATTGVNTIVSGNLDIALYQGVVSEGAISYPAEVTNTTKLFKEDTLWEPGHTEVVYLKVENKGSLALKYQLTVNAINEVAGVSVLGNVIQLSNYLKYDVVEIDEDEYYATREAAIDAIENEQNLATEVITGDMTSGETLYLALIVYMPTTVGNEANHVTGTTVPSIDLGVNLLATQYTYENDSYGPDYDQNAPFIPEGAEIINIGTAEELAAFAASNNTSENAYVMLTADIDMTGVAYTSIANFAGTFNGMGHTVSNLTDASFFGTVTGTVQNLNLDGVNRAFTAYTNKGTSAFIGTVASGAVVDNCTVSDVALTWADTVKDCGDGISGVIGTVNTGATVKNCEFNDVTITAQGKLKRTGGVFGVIAGTVSNCDVDGVSIIATGKGCTQEAGGFVRQISNNATISDCTVNNV